MSENRSNEKQILIDIIEEFNPEKFVRFFREKNRSFAPRREDLPQYNDDDFKNGIKLGEIKFAQDEQMVVCSFQAGQPLSERSGKKAQYEKGKRILKDSQSDAGIFIFYDTNNNFRFSLIYAEYLGVRRRFSYFKRLTFFVSPRLTNKTFFQQIGESDFSSLQKIKEAFSVEPVTRQFYGELQYWYFWAMDKIKFPDDYKYSDDSAKDKEIRNATNLIRLITRIIFIRFLTEKGLIPPELFSREKLGRIVKDFMKSKKASDFYNAILQNLFFGTLNQKMNERKFALEGDFLTNRKEYGVKNLYRYGDKFLIRKDEVLALFKDIPFLNGGLFDCLDKDMEKVYVDGFSRNPAKQSIIPDYLFFQQEEERVDLSNYGLGASRPVRGLIEILNSYNFTVDENTPIDLEIALDPELLGKVFENLLASYNPETATTARKATGSYYTPREIVDYMVEESLFEYLKGKLSVTEEEKIRMLLSYSEEIPEFSEPERQKIISAIDDIKILDPACGSGAFPMGILHKLVYALQKLDPENKYWHELQYQKALKESGEVFKQDDKNERQEKLKEINEAFDEGINYPDYARKLYLIENCIYGVDIQSIAIQISKLRFFISLVLDQKVDRGKENLGIRALPNLETKFVAANTLIGLDKPVQLAFKNPDIEKKEEELKQIRHKYFDAKTRKEKLDYQKKDQQLRKVIADLLKDGGWDKSTAEKIAGFDLYDQNASVDWFDPEWMFGIKSPSPLAGEGAGEGGFDVVIANPPYLGEKGNKETFRLIAASPWGSRYYKRKMDLFYFFFHLALDLAKKSGSVCFITTSYWITADGALKLRSDVKDHATVLQLLNFGELKLFATAQGQHNMITHLAKNGAVSVARTLMTRRSGEAQPELIKSILDGNDPETAYYQIEQQQLFDGVENYIRLTPTNVNVACDGPGSLNFAKIDSVSSHLSDYAEYVFMGVQTGCDVVTDNLIEAALEKRLITASEASRFARGTGIFVLTHGELAKLHLTVAEKRECVKPFYKNSEIGRYITFPNNEKVLLYVDSHTDIDRYPNIKNHLKQFRSLLAAREQAVTEKHNWFWIRGAKRESYFYRSDAIVVPYRATSSRFSICNQDIFGAGDLYYISLRKRFSTRALLGFLNSSLVFYHLLNRGKRKGQVIEYYKNPLEKIPIHKRLLEDDECTGRFESVVDRILAVKRRDAEANTSAMEREIDRLVYDLYGLTKEEIAIVEGKG